MLATTREPSVSRRRGFTFSALGGASDVIYDVSDLGGGVLHGLAAIEGAARALDDQDPVAHHVTNVVVTSLAPTPHERRHSSS